MNVPTPVCTCARPREIAREWIVAAGIEEHDAGLALAFKLHLLQHKVERNGFKIEITLALQLSIDRHEMVAARHLQSVAGIEQQAGVRLGEGAGKIAHLGVERLLVEVEAEDHRKPERRKRRRHVAGVVDGVRERPCV